MKYLSDIKFSIAQVQAKLNEMEISDSDRDDLIGWIKYAQFKMYHLEARMHYVQENESNPQPPRTVYTIEWQGFAMTEFLDREGIEYFVTEADIVCIVLHTWNDTDFFNLISKFNKEQNSTENK